MKKLLFLTLLIFIGCSDATTPVYVVDGARPLMVVVTPPDVALEESFAAQLYMGGRRINQTDGVEVHWISPDAPPLPYDQPLTGTVTEELLDQIPDSSGINVDALLETLETEGYTDIPLFATTHLTEELNGDAPERNIIIQKRFRLRKEPLEDREFHHNPDINLIVFSAMQNGGYRSQMITAQGEVIQFDSDEMPDYIGLHATTKIDEAIYEQKGIRLVWRWFFTPDKQENIDSLPEVSYDAEEGSAVFPGGADALGYRNAHLLLSLKDIKQEITATTKASFDIYLTVQDKTTNGEKDDYRFGADFFFLTININ